MIIFIDQYMVGNEQTLRIHAKRVEINRRTNRRTDGRTDERTASLDWRRHTNYLQNVNFIMIRVNSNVLSTNKINCK